MAEGNRLRMRANRWSRDTKPVTSDTEWITDENATLSHVAGVILRLRINVQRVSPGASLTTTLHLFYTKNGGVDTRITTTSSNIIMVPSAHYANQAANLNLFLSGGAGTIIDSDNGMHVAGSPAQTASFAFPAAARRFESEWAFRVIPEDVVAGDAFRFIMKRSNGDDFELSPFQTADLTILESSFPGAVTIGSVELNPVATQGGASLLPVADAPALVTLQAVAEHLGVSVQAVATADTATLEAMATQAGTTLEALVSIAGATLNPVTEGS